MGFGKPDTEFGPFQIIRPLTPFMLRGDSSVRANIVSYKSGPLTITGWLYLPPLEKTPPPVSSHPLDLPAPPGGALIVGHGGIDGVPAHYDYALRRLAFAGWTIAAPDYRGESGSEGNVEFALGEADDLLACWTAVTSLPDVNPSSTWLLGSSHGAMASMMALSRSNCPPGIPGAIAMWGAYNIPAWLDWMEQLKHPGLNEPFIRSLLTMDESALDARSAIKHASEIRGSVLLLHGKEDTIIPYTQSVAMSEALAIAGNPNYTLRIGSPADHEYIWGPDRMEAIQGWQAIIEFTGVNKQG
jgi:dipeptidyl aminopeptidase/acylaminoacyl peptidase